MTLNELIAQMKSEGADRVSIGSGVSDLSFWRASSRKFGTFCLCAKYGDSWSIDTNWAYYYDEIPAINPDAIYPVIEIDDFETIGNLVLAINIAKKLPWGDPGGNPKDVERVSKVLRHADEISREEFNHLYRNQ